VCLTSRAGTGLWVLAIRAMVAFPHGSRFYSKVEAYELAWSPLFHG